MTMDQIVGCRIREEWPEAVRNGLVDQYLRVFNSGKPLALDGFPFDYRDRRGTLRRLDIRAVKVGDDLSVTWRDVTEQAVNEEELKRRATTDSLTNLLNRAEIFRVAQQFLTGDQRQGRNVAVLFCDLDRFKQVNDRYGHRSGDLVLQAMAQRIRSCLRSSDLAARVGGDELMVILPGMHSLEDAVAIAEKVRSLARQPVPIPQGEVRISVSVGAALACPGDSLDELISRADSLMYQAKQQGRDQVVSIGCDCANSPSG